MESLKTLAKPEGSVKERPCHGIRRCAEMVATGCELLYRMESSNKKEGSE
jgi:hypothetical protein